ncbi:MAG: DUF262 domain-containing protein [Nitrospirae bacterium]|uniref:DUF262 domain-containing protein n=1 Tax=Candidatus Magnetobacterium casense TaxID=1455061 RepID=UPI0005906236|nr:DUF262 domain-containing protein [Candidatus Magnetobacterium casensis]MBF0336742.1 DUF262 domain-containing protein [Nitrospirota bacterium]
MAFQTPITVKEAVDNIHTKKYLLPAIQREVVWDTDQIVCLFDSLMRDYPIGSFLFWYVTRNNTDKYQFYEFVREYHERDNCHNAKANLNGQDDITGVLDGQQRLTSLYIGLRGSYAYKEPRKRWNNPLAFPARKLYLNLLSPYEGNDQIDMQFDFAFLTDQEANQHDEGAFWFMVGHILSFKNQASVNTYMINQQLMQRPEEQAIFANEALFKLWSIIHEKPVINYFLERDTSLHKVLNIFIRINSGGTTLSYSDLLLSTATAQWEERDAREEVTALVDQLNDIGDGFNFDKDFVLKSSLVLSDFTEIAFKVDNFNKTNMRKIEQQWDEITQALLKAVTLVSGLGYCRNTLTSNYAVIPIAYYMKKIGSPANFDVAQKYSGERKAIQKWLILSLIKRVFGGTPDSVLRPIREILKETHNGFPLTEIIDKFKGTNKSLSFVDDDIELILDYRYDQTYTFSTLALLYPSLDFRNNFHIDHIHPFSHFTRTKLRRRGIRDNDTELYIEHVNTLPNLQLLEGIPNQEKNDTAFADWFGGNNPTKDMQDSYRKRHYIPDVDLSLSNFMNFIEERKYLIRNQLKHLLGVT